MMKLMKETIPISAPNSLLATLAHSTSSTGAFNLLKFVLSHEEEEEEAVIPQIRN